MFRKYLDIVEQSFAGKLILTTIKEFFKEKSFFHGAALAYYTVFAMVPMLYLSITFFGWFVGNETMVEIITNLLRNQIGLKDIDGLLEFLKEIDFEKGSFVLNTIGITALILSSTALLNSLKLSINEFYDVIPEFSNKRKKIMSALTSKLISVTLLTGIGLVVIVFYFSQAVLLSLSSEFFNDYSFVSWLFNFILVHSIAIITNTLIFSFVFKFLHDGIVRWRIAFFGAAFTGTLLYLGQVGIKYYLTNFFFAASGGVAGSIILILVWMYYSSQIIFLGAKFTKVLADLRHLPITNKKY